MNNSLLEPPSSWAYSHKAWQECVAALLELEWRRCKEDPWYFIRTFPRTRDQLDSKRPFKPFPNLPYLAHLTDIYLTERVAVVPKSRRTIATWHAVAFNLWDCLFWDGRLCGFQNETQDKANEMIAMAEVMYTSLPAWMKARSPAKFTASRATFTARHSDIIALPKGPDVLRMYTFSRITSDEVGQQQHCPETYKAAKQTITGRDQEHTGQLIYIGTAKDAWWELLVNDKLETETPPPPTWRVQLFPEARPKCDCAVDRCKCRYGMEVVRQATTDYMVVWLHYTADPEKRSAEWLEFAKKGIPPEDWAQEMDIDFTAKSGKKALAVFTKYRNKIVVKPFKIPAWWPRWSSHDYGFSNPYSCHYYTMAPDGTVYAYWEHYQPGPLNIHLAAIRSCEDFDKVTLRILDRSCWTAWNQSSQTIEGQTSHMVKSIAQMHTDAGVDCIPAAAPQDRVKLEAFYKMWDEQALEDGGEPKFKIFDVCTALITELPGIRWQTRSYGDKLSGMAAEKLVDADNHAFDEASYSLLHIATPGNEPKPAKMMTDEEVRADMRKQIQEDNYARIEEEYEQGRAAGEEAYGDFGLD